jgi:hypothetical protein
MAVEVVMSHCVVDRKRRERIRIIGLCSEMSKVDARQALIRVIAIARGRAGPVQNFEGSCLVDDAKSVVSLFEGASRLKKQPSPLSVIGNRRITDLTREGTVSAQ